jgi:hypothetical protein
MVAYVYYPFTMARLTTTETQARKLQTLLQTSLTDSDLQAIPTEDILRRLVDLIYKKDKSPLPARLLTQLDNRVLVDVEPGVRLELLTSLLVKTKPPSEEEMSLDQLEGVRGAVANDLR